MLHASDAKEFKDNFPLPLSSVPISASLSFVFASLYSDSRNTHSENGFLTKKNVKKNCLGETKNSRRVEQAEAAGHHIIKLNY